MVRIKFFNFIYNLTYGQDYLQNIYIFKAQEVEETMKRIQSHKGVVGTIVVNAEGTWEDWYDLFRKEIW